MGIFLDVFSVLEGMKVKELFKPRRVPSLFNGTSMSKVDSFKPSTKFCLSGLKDEIDRQGLKWMSWSCYDDLGKSYHSYVSSL